MKILIISDAWRPQINGVVRTYEYISAELEKMGHTVKVIGPADFPLTFPLPTYSEIKLVIAPGPVLKRMIEDFAPDAIHIGTEGPLGWAAHHYCVKRNIPFTTCYHTQFPDYVAKRFAKIADFLYNPTHVLALNTIKKFHRKSKAMMVASKGLEQDLRALGFENPMKELTRGVKFDLFHPGEKTLFQDKIRPVALYVGRIAIEKNLEDFLDMPWDGTKVLVGEGPSFDDLKMKYPNAIFAGKKTGPELAAYYRSADVFVFPSRTDTFGMVVTEALACGLPVAAYNVTGPKDIITKDFLGVLCDTRDQLGQAALKALHVGTAEQRASYTAQHYTWPLVAKQFLDAIA